MKAPSCPTVRNARFWTWENDGWVKITLKPGESITHSTGGPTDEGYSWGASTWTHNFDHLTCEYNSHESDCDGPMSNHVELCVDMKDLNAREEGGVEGNEYWMPSRPDWERKSAFQRDLYAEMAGY